MAKTDTHTDNPFATLSPFPTPPEEAPPLSHDWRFAHLRADLCDRIRATQADPDQYSITDQGTDTFTVDVTETWTIAVRKTEQTLAGEQTDGTVRCSSLSELISTLESMTKRILAGAGPKALTERLSRRKPAVLTPATPIDDLVTARCSHCRHCEQCGGTGKKTCPSCYGRGIKSVTRYNAGQNTSYTVMEPCAYCHSGYISCGTCDGSGFETTLVTIKAYATPAYSHHGRAETPARSQAILNDTDSNAVIAAFPVTPDGPPQSSGPATVTSTFSGPAMITFVGVTSPKQSRWTVCGVGRTAQYLKPPPVLDELLEDGIQTLTDAGRISRRDRLKVLNNMLQVPLLEEMLRQHAANRAAGHARNFGIVAHSLVSIKIADKAGRAVADILDDLCPRYAADLWTVIGLFVVMALLIIPNHQRLIPHSHVWAWSGVGAYVAGLILCRALTLYRRRLVPRQYRPPIEEWKPALLMLGLMVTGVGLSVVAPRQVEAVTEPPARLLSRLLTADTPWFEGLSAPSALTAPSLTAPSLTAPSLSPRPAAVPAPSPPVRTPGPASGTTRPAVLSGPATLIDTATVQIGGTVVRLNGLDAVQHPVPEAGLRQYLSVVGDLRCKAAATDYTCTTESGADFAEVVALSGYAKVRTGAPRALTAAEAEARRTRTGIWGISGLGG